ncbi:MAG: hypothetical protein ACUVTP_04570 [Candidatus Fervidibacter sp.]|uniref:hypothetical protein n=1 Tax=Candidatus Fervidibacter sp. TaxID=3100871 RepID=UPI00404A45FE
MVETDELLIMEEHTHIFGILAFQQGRWWRRWQFLKLWGPSVDFFILTADGREWLVTVKRGGETVQALTFR